MALGELCAAANATAARAQEFEQVRDLKNLQSLSAAENRGTVTNLVIAADSKGKVLILRVVANPPAIAASVVKEQLLSQRGDVFSSVALSACPGTVTVDCIVQLAVQCGILSALPDSVAAVPAKMRYRLAGRLARATATLALAYLSAGRAVGGIPYEPHGDHRSY